MQLPWCIIRIQLRHGMSALHHQHTVSMHCAKIRTAAGTGSMEQITPTNSLGHHNVMAIEWHYLQFAMQSPHFIHSEFSIVSTTLRIINAIADQCVVTKNSVATTKRTLHQVMITI